MSLVSRSLSKPTTWESERIRVCKENGCLVCRYQGHWACSLPIEYHHLLSGGLRLGHRYGVALCAYHHQGGVRRGYTKEEMRERFGPNLKDDGRVFKALHGTNQEMLDKQDELIGYLKTTIPDRPQRNRKSKCTPAANQHPRDPYASKCHDTAREAFKADPRNVKRRKKSRCTASAKTFPRQGYSR